MSGARAVRVGSPAGQTVTPVGDNGGEAHPVTVVARPPIVDVGQAPTGTPLVLRKGPDGRLRPEALALPEVWGDPIRFRRGAPEQPGPPGAIHIDTTTGRGYRSTEIDIEES